MDSQDKWTEKIIRHTSWLIIGTASLAAWLFMTDAETAAGLGWLLAIPIALLPPAMVALVHGEIRQLVKLLERRAHHAGLPPLIAEDSSFRGLYPGLGKQSLCDGQPAGGQRPSRGRRPVLPQLDLQPAATLPAASKPADVISGPWPASSTGKQPEAPPPQRGSQPRLVPK